MESILKANMSDSECDDWYSLGAKAGLGATYEAVHFRRQTSLFALTVVL